MATQAGISQAISLTEGLVKPKATLNSWKEIATYFDRGVRTVQRWEAELGLPVYRIRDTAHSPVFAFRSELSTWLENRRKADGRKLPLSNPELVAGVSFSRRVEVRKRWQTLAKQADTLLTEQARATEQLRKNIVRLRSTLDQVQNRDRRPAFAMVLGENKTSGLPAEEPRQRSAPAKI